MVQAKKQKAKPKKQLQVKKHGKQADNTQFRAQLDALGLKIVQITADGNCFFRALADQLEGNEDEHQKYRTMVVQYIVKNREMFEPFIEDEVPFDEYCRTMESDGTWAGNMELQAASLVTRNNVCIHRNMSPRWYIRNFDQPGSRMIHLKKDRSIGHLETFMNIPNGLLRSYHDGEHYNSVRAKEDPCDGPARPVIIKADSVISSSSRNAKPVSEKSNGGPGNSRSDAGSVKLVIAGSGCEDTEKVEQILQQMGGDVDAAIEYLIAEQGAEESSGETNSTSIQLQTAYGGDANINSNQLNEEIANETMKQDQPSSNSIKKTHRDGNAPSEDKKISRNKACPCGSKKKYKSCCGTVKGRPSLTIVNQVVDSNKSRKSKRQGTKGGATVPSEASSESDGRPPDLGALCI